MQNRDPYVEYHDGDEPAICVGQWCCGCNEHPQGKPWGWASDRWQQHWAEGCHPIYNAYGEGPKAA